MPTMICKSCGAMIHYGENDRYAVCEYCDTEVKIQRDTAVDAARVQRPIEKVTNALVCSVPSCGATVFQRKTFNVYTHFAELVDTKTGKVDPSHRLFSCEDKRHVFGNKYCFYHGKRRKDHGKTDVFRQSRKSTGSTQRTGIKISAGKFPADIYFR